MKRILTIDGGGILGTVPATILAEIEKQLPVKQHPADYFDLISGTSTGGIIALGLAHRVPAHKILEFYQDYGPSIFPTYSWWNIPQRLWRFCKQIIWAKFNQKPLRDALDKVFGQTLLGESKSRLVIPSMSLITGQVRLFKTRHAERFKKDPLESMVDVALATSAAPTYLPPHLTPSGMSTLDGGLWANNPTAVAIVEAIGVLGWDREDIQVLSLGCTKKASGYSDIKRGGLFGWGKGLRIVEVFMEGQASGSHAMAQILTGEGGGTPGTKIMRIEQTVAPDLAVMDNSRRITKLKGLGSELAMHHMPEIQRRFITSGPTNEFVPLPLPELDKLIQERKL